jgi:site-specific DNA-methyltransferase (adenine-specific)
MITPYFKSDDKDFYLLQRRYNEPLPQFEHKFDMVFADPPYFLSNNGFLFKAEKL